MINNIGQLLFQKFQLLDDCLLNELSKSKFGKISKSQSMIFACLDEGDVTISDIAKKLGISRQAVQKTVSELVIRKLLILNKSQKNRSAKIVKLTSTGTKCVKLAQDTYSELEFKISKIIGAKRLKELKEILDSDWRL